MTCERSSPVICATPVWDGGRFLGHLIERRSAQFEPVPPNGVSLGLFNTEAAALGALIGAQEKAD
jgi:hypothetical protein